MIDNCFIDNNFIGEGTVLLASASDLVESSGNYGTKDDSISCQYVHIGTGDAFECIEFEATECAFGPSAGVPPVDGPPVDTPVAVSSTAPPLFPSLAVLVPLLFVMM